MFGVHSWATEFVSHQIDSVSGGFLLWAYPVHTQPIESGYLSFHDHVPVRRKFLFIFMLQNPDGFVVGFQKPTSIALN